MYCKCYYTNKYVEYKMAYILDKKNLEKKFDYENWLRYIYYTCNCKKK